MSQILLDLPACFGTALMIGKYSLSSLAFIGTTSGLAQGLVLQLGEDAPISELPHGVTILMRVDSRGSVLQKDAVFQRNSKQPWDSLLRAIPHSQTPGELTQST
jgi:hypothetical protein